MRQRLVAALWLLLLATGQAGALVRPLAASTNHDCRCDERLCRCTHKHRPASLPKCHFPGGSPMPSLQSCDTSQEQALAVGVYLVPLPPALTGPLGVQALVPTGLALTSDFFDDISPPPPRFPLS